MLIKNIFRVTEEIGLHDTRAYFEHEAYTVYCILYTCSLSQVWYTYLHKTIYM